ncbi:MAG: type II secretion system protein M [Peptococcaceae bacterium]|nr:type II secretion system protein M [Peptococcaceae bacterium]
MKTRLAIREKALLTILLVFLLILGYYIYVLQPLLARQAALTASIASLELEVARLEPLEKQETALRQEIASLIAEELLLATTEEPMNLPQLLVFLEGVAKARLVGLDTIGLQNINPVDGGLVTLTARGTYPFLWSFLQALEGQPETLSLEQVIFNADGEAVSADLTFRLVGAVIPEQPGLSVPVRLSPFTLGR